MNGKVLIYMIVVNTNKRRTEEIKKILEDRRSGKSAGSAEMQKIRGHLNETRDKFKELVVRICVMIDYYGSIGALDVTGNVAITRRSDSNICDAL